MDLAEITPLLLTYNEEANIQRALKGVEWARQVVVVDSESTDRTAELVQNNAHARLVARRFDSHTGQWNFGLAQVTTPWVLALDADYVCPESLADELRTLESQWEAYAARFRYCIQGRRLRGTLYPPRVVLFRADRFRYRQDGHTQVLDVDADVGQLKSVILHDDRKPLGRWLESQTKYADLEVEKLRSTRPEGLSWKDRLRKRIVIAPMLTLFYCLIGKRLILDGWPGVYYTLQRVYAELLLSVKLLEAKLAGSKALKAASTSTSTVKAGENDPCEGMLRGQKTGRIEPQRHGEH